MLTPREAAICGRAGDRRLASSWNSSTVSTSALISRIARVPRSIEAAGVLSTSRVTGLTCAAGFAHSGPRCAPLPVRGDARGGDRKSTRLNSSHVAISYAVFCLKKKTEQGDATDDRSHAGAGDGARRDAG